jgi:hypothetical protein
VYTERYGNRQRLQQFHRTPANPSVFKSGSYTAVPCNSEWRFWLGMGLPNFRLPGGCPLNSGGAAASPSPQGTAYLSPAFQCWVCVYGRSRVPIGTAYGSPKHITPVVGRAGLA